MWSDSVWVQDPKYEWKKKNIVYKRFLQYWFTWYLRVIYRTNIRKQCCNFAPACCMGILRTDYTNSVFYEQEWHSSMASSSVSQEDVDLDFETSSRRSRIRTARARNINPPSRPGMLVAYFLIECLLSWLNVDILWLCDITLASCPRAIVFNLHTKRLRLELTHCSSFYLYSWYAGLKLFLCKVFLALLWFMLWFG